MTRMQFPEEAAFDLIAPDRLEPDLGENCRYCRVQRGHQRSDVLQVAQALRQLCKGHNRSTSVEVDLP